MNSCSKYIEQNAYKYIQSFVLLVSISVGADGAFYPDEIQRPPVRTSSSWELENNVVCSQPSRNLSRPDGLEDPEDSNVCYLLHSFIYH